MTEAHHNLYLPGAEAGANGREDECRDEICLVLHVPRQRYRHLRTEQSQNRIEQSQKRAEQSQKRAEQSEKSASCSMSPVSVIATCFPGLALEQSENHSIESEKRAEQSEKKRAELSQKSASCSPSPVSTIATCIDRSQSEIPQHTISF
jgi:hypothetical protein